MVCINCESEHNSNFCPNCGERAQVSKITIKSIINEGFATLTNMDKGFLYNVKQLTLNPAQLVKDYINGKRRNILNPISFLIISVSLYLIVDSMIPREAQTEATRSGFYDAGRRIGGFIKNYFKYYWILSVVWLSTSTFLVFRRYNFAEHLAINSFIVAQATLIGIITALLFNLPLLVNGIVYCVLLAMIYFIFKTKDKRIETIFNAIVVLLLYFIQLLVLLGCLALVTG